MHAICAGLDSCVDGATAGAPILRIESVGHHLEFLDGFHIWRNLPGAGEAYGRAIQQKLICALHATVHDVLAVCIPATGARKAVGPKLFLRE